MRNVVNMAVFRATAKHRPAEPRDKKNWVQRDPLRFLNVAVEFGLCAGWAPFVNCRTGSEFRILPRAVFG
jgi:hypothetical protein